MGDKTGIEWTDATWNPVRGCTRISPGCVNCYAESIAARFSGPGMPYEGLARMTPSGPRWTGKFRLVDRHLLDPLRWKKPRKVFVNSMSDLFHESMPDEWIDKVFAVMCMAKEHTFQVLTKRSRRMRDYFAQGMEKLTYRWGWEAQAIMRSRGDDATDKEPKWPPSNVWLGVSVEDQANADKRLPDLIATPAAVRFVSYEPALGPVDFMMLGVEGTEECAGLNALTGEQPCCHDHPDVSLWHGSVDWVICGCESAQPGRPARPMNLDWVRRVRDQCVIEHVAFFFKQAYIDGELVGTPELDGRKWEQYPEAVTA